MMKVYGNKPIPIIEMEIDNSEMYYYQYLPIKLAESDEIIIPKQLLKLKDLISKAIYDFVIELDKSLFFDEHLCYC